MEQTTQQVSYNRNPTGRGGFAEHPEHQSPGGWKKENTLSYQYHRFLNMSAGEFEAFAKTPKDKMTMAEYGAWNRVKQLKTSLPDAKEIADRTEGKAFQAMDLTSGGKELGIGLSAEQAEQLIRARADRSDTE